jgi:hypothetical protein
MSIFDVVLEFKALAYLPTLGSIEAYFQKASNIMNKNFFYLTKDSVLQDLPIIINRVKSSNIAIPVVESESKKILLFNVQAHSLIAYIQAHFNSI